MSTDRIKKFAGILVDYSLKIKAGDLFLIKGETGALPLMKEVFKLAVKKGAIPYIKIEHCDLKEYFYKNAKTRQLKFCSPIEKYEMKKVDALLSIIGSENTCYLRNVAPVKIATKTKGYMPVRKIYMDRSGTGDLKWCVTLFPTNALAQDTGMSLSEFEEFVYSACKINSNNPVNQWKKVSSLQAKLVKFLNRKNEFRVTGDDVNLKFKTHDRIWINCDGKNNFPDGEIFTCPLENSVEGYIRFNLPQYYNGKVITDIHLKFEKGKIVKFSAEKGREFLKEIMNIDRGVKRLGEFAIGTNYNIKHQCKNILFDEKIGGTIHMAVGASIKSAGGKNISSIHWDMIHRMKKNHCIYADNILIYKNSRFKI